MFRALLVTVVIGILVACSSTPEESDGSHMSELEAIAVVQTWLGQMVYGFTSLQEAKIPVAIDLTSVLPRIREYDAEIPVQNIESCLEYHRTRSMGEFEAHYITDPGGVWGVTHETRSGRHSWFVFEDSLAILSDESPRNIC